MRDLVFYLALGALFTHELDAMPNHEWRNLPLLGSLADDTAMVWFVMLHVPLFAGIIALVGSRDLRVRTASRLGIAGFIVIHGLLHWLSTGTPRYEFGSTMSHVLIFGGALLGSVYLGLQIRSHLGSR